MQKTLLITGATDGIGLETARRLVSLGHHVLLHGRSPEKLEAAERQLSALSGAGRIERFVADLSDMAEVAELAAEVSAQRSRLDVLINNAGVYRAPTPRTRDGLDVRFAVNTLAPYLLTQRLLPLLGSSGRVVNLSSAAQSPVDPAALSGAADLTEGAAYAQSKLALTMWSRTLAGALGGEGPSIIAVNPGSLLDTKMVQEAFGAARGGAGIGAEIVCRAALSDEFDGATGQYFDNDTGRFAPPHPDALDSTKSQEVTRLVEALLTERTAP